MNAWRQLVINLKLCLDWPICFNLKYVKNVHLFKSFSINISIHVWRCTQFVQQIYFDTMDSALSTLIWITGNKVVTFSWNMSKSENISADFPLTKSSRVFDPALTLVHSSCILLPYIILINIVCWGSIHQKKPVCLVPDILLMRFVIVNCLTLIYSALNFYMKLNTCISHSMI